MEKILIFGHKNPDTDTIMSAIAMANLKNKLKKEAKAYRLGNINKETKFALDYFRQEEPELLEDLENSQSVILVDHNDFGQSVKNIENANILEVVDHHKISGFSTSEPLYYTAMPVGCTATIIYGMYKNKNIEIDSKIAGLMASAIISDTLLLKSPTTTDLDKKVLEELGKIAKIDVKEYGLEMLKAGTDLSDFSAEELINIDSKPFSTNGVNYQVAQVNTASIEEVIKYKEKIENAMKNFISKNSQDSFVLLITDILENNSQILVAGSRKDIAEKAFNVKLNDNTAFLPGVVSRKKQVVPVIDKNC